METLGERLGVVVRSPATEIYNPDTACALQVAAFYQMWRAARLSTRRLYTVTTKKVALNHSVIVHAHFAGQTLQFAQILKDDPSLVMSGSTGPVFEFEKVARSANALTELLFSTWLPNLQPVLMDDQAWIEFLKIVQIFGTGGDPEEQIDLLATQIGLDPQAVRIRASFYAREVVAEWFRWFTAIGDNIPLPRI